MLPWVRSRDKNWKLKWKSILCNLNIKTERCYCLSLFKKKEVSHTRVTSTSRCKGNRWIIYKVYASRIQVLLYINFNDISTNTSTFIHVDVRIMFEYIKFCTICINYLLSFKSFVSILNYLFMVTRYYFKRLVKY